jgi:hypothetical protein
MEACIDTYKEILETEMCLFALSKSVQGRLALARDPILGGCPDLGCRTSKLQQQISLHSVQSGPCDSTEGKELGGTIDIQPFIQAFADANSSGRGIHAGEFHWNAGVTQVTGTISGTSGADTLWLPPENPQAVLQRQCSRAGLLLGRFCGTVTAGEKIPKGSQVFGTYRLFVQAPQGGSAVFGTMEGVIIRKC